MFACVCAYKRAYMCMWFSATILYERIITHYYRIKCSMVFNENAPLMSSDLHVFYDVYIRYFSLHVLSPVAPTRDRF